MHTPDHYVQRWRILTAFTAQFCGNFVNGAFVVIFGVSGDWTTKLQSWCDAYDNDCALRLQRYERHGTLWYKVQNAEHDTWVWQQMSYPSIGLVMRLLGSSRLVRIPVFQLQLFRISRSTSRVKVISRRSRSQEETTTGFRRRLCLCLLWPWPLTFWFLNLISTSTNPSIHLWA